MLIHPLPRIESRRRHLAEDISCGSYIAPMKKSERHVSTVNVFFYPVSGGSVDYLLIRNASGTDLRCATARVQFDAVASSTIVGLSPATDAAAKVKPSG